MVFRDGDLTWLEQDRTGRTTHRGEGVVRGAGGNGEHLQPLLAYIGEGKFCYHRTAGITLSAWDENLARHCIG